MSLTAVFAEHEIRTQLRSSRFPLLCVGYLLLASSPAMVLAFKAHRVDYAIGSGTWAEALMVVQPLATAIFAALLSVDAVSREREEGSFAILALVPMSNGGYLLRRWVAILIMILPLTIVPEIIAFALAARARSGPLQASFFVFQWLFHVAPLAVISSALAMALGTIAGRTMLAAMFGVAVFSLVLVWGNDILASQRLHLEGPAELLGFSPARFEQTSWVLKGYRSLQSASDAPYDFRAALARLLPAMMLTLGIAAALLGCATAFLRRSRRDLRPWRASGDHPFRTAIRLANRIREDFALDPVLGWRDRLVIAFGIAGGILALAWLFRAESHFSQLAASRAAVELAALPAPTPLSIAAQRIGLAGMIRNDGSVSSRVELTLRNEGVAEVGELAFSLNSNLIVARASADQGSVRIGRRWDRLAARLEPPLAPGKRRTITFELRGAPAEYDFPLHGNNTFLSRYSSFRRAREASDLSDLSRTLVRYAVSRKQIALQGSDIMPVLRYTPWELTKRTKEFEPAGDRVVEERHFPVSQIDLDLVLPPGTFLADSCGNGGTGRTVGTCRASAQAYELIGGPLQPVTISPDATLALLAVHRDVAAVHGPALARSLALAARAWPGLPIPANTLFVERPSEEDEQWYGDFSPLFAQRSIGSAGAVRVLPELMLARRKPLAPGVIAASIIAHALGSRRAVAPAEQIFFSHLFEMLALSRVGDRRRSAVIGAIGPAPDREPLLPAAQYGGWQRMQAVMADVEARAGADQLVSGVNDFLDAGGDGTAHELLAAIGRRGGVSLDRVYSDFFIGSDLPELTLDGVTFSQRGAQWLVSGTLENRGTGEVFCPVVLRTDFESIRRIVRIDSHQKVHFSMTTAYQPRVVQLDPDGICYRYAALGTVDHVDYRSGS
jgi:ABC-type transport system involved in multi-copper enzyme maturation permease subunit